MAIASSSITESTALDARHHSNMDKNDFNMHLPIGYRSSNGGTSLMVGETGDYVYEMGALPAALDYKAADSADGVTPSDGDIYLLDDSVTVLTITSIAWQSGTTVRYTFSGSPDLSGYSTVNNVGYIYGTGITNSEHLGRFDLTAVDNTTKYIEVTNPLVTDATLDESSLSNSSAELPHSDWNGASNGDFVRYSGTDSLYYRISPVTGATCYDKTLLQTRTYNGSKWLGQRREISIAASDETTVLTTGTAKATFVVFGDFLLSDVVVSLTTAGTTSGNTTIDINDDGASLGGNIPISVTFGDTFETNTSTNLIESQSEITIDIDAISGGGTEAGLKVYLIGYYI